MSRVRRGESRPGPDERDLSNWALEGGASVEAVTGRSFGSEERARVEGARFCTALGAGAVVGAGDPGTGLNIALLCFCLSMASLRSTASW